MISAKVEGMENLISSLKILPVNIQKNVMVGAVRAGTKPIIEDAKKNINDDTGILKKAIGSRKRKVDDKNVISFAVGPITKRMHLLQDRRNEKHYNYGNIVEVGREGNNWVNKEFGTSTSVAEPFMRPAYEAEGNKSIEATTKYIAQRIDKEIEKARR